MNRPIALLSILLLAAAPARGQTVRDLPLPPTGRVPMIADSELALVTYEPRALPLEELYGVAQTLFGTFVSVEKLVEGSRDDHELVQLEQFLPFGDGLLIRNSRAHSQRIVETLQALEQAQAEARAPAVGAAGAAAADGSAVRIEDGIVTGALERIELRPRHVPLALLRTAFDGYARPVRSVAGEPARPNFTWLPAANQLLVEETRERITLLRERIAQVDRPFQQVFVTALVLDLDATTDPKQVPADLARELATLMPGSGFRVVSSAVLRTQIRPDLACQLGSESESGMKWDLSFFAESFDAERGSMNLSQCEFALQRHPQNDLFPGRQGKQRFQTQLQLELGEWAVVGAIGAQPVLVALRMAPVPGPAR